MAATRALETKYRIAETAMQLFLEQGYESVTVEAVADASEVSRRTVFRYYAGKKELPFPDHSERVALVERHLVDAGPDADPVEAVIAATEASMHDFLAGGARAPALPADPGRARAARPRGRRARTVRRGDAWLPARATAGERGSPTSPWHWPLSSTRHTDPLWGTGPAAGGRPTPSPSSRRGWTGSAPSSPGVADRGRSSLAVLPDSARTRRSLSALRDRASETL